VAYSAPANIRSAGSTKIASAGAQQAYAILHFGFVVLPLVAGIDKFFNLMTDWTKYLAPAVALNVPIGPYTLMQMVGVVEIIAGLIVAYKPRIGAYILAVWFLGIIANLAVNSTPYWDVVARDFGLILGALALGALSTSANTKDG